MQSETLKQTFRLHQSVNKCIYADEIKRNSSNHWRVCISVAYLEQVASISLTTQFPIKFQNAVESTRQPWKYLCKMQWIIANRSNQLSIEIHLVGVNFVFITCTIKWVAQCRHRVRSLCILCKSAADWLRIEFHIIIYAYSVYAARHSLRIWFMGANKSCHMYAHVSGVVSHQIKCEASRVTAGRRAKRPETHKRNIRTETRIYGCI